MESGEGVRSVQRREECCPEQPIGKAVPGNACQQYQLGPVSQMWSQNPAEVGHWKLHPHVEVPPWGLSS